MKLRSRPEVKPVETIDGQVTDFSMQAHAGLVTSLVCQNLIVTMSIPVGDLTFNEIREMISSMRYGIQVVKPTNPREAK